jgi:hypothetical protein
MIHTQCVSNKGKLGGLCKRWNHGADIDYIGNDDDQLNLADSTEED